MILSFLRKDPSLDAGQALYAAAVEQARRPALYREYGVPDTVEGRFEQIALHVWLILRGLKSDDPAAKKVGQKLFDVMFENLDDSLRELGVGDLIVGKKIRKLAENFYGRIGAYEVALGPEAGETDLAAALARNIYDTDDDACAARLARYARASAELIAEQPVSRLAGGIVRFAEPEEVA